MWVVVGYNKNMPAEPAHNNTLADSLGTSNHNTRKLVHDMSDLDTSTIDHDNPFDYIDSLSLKELRKEAKELGLPTAGTRSDLVAALHDYYINYDATIDADPIDTDPIDAAPDTAPDAEPVVELDAGQIASDYIAARDAAAAAHRAETAAAESLGTLIRTARETIFGSRPPAAKATGLTVAQLAGIELGRCPTTDELVALAGPLALPILIDIAAR